MKKILITDHLHPLLATGLKRAGFEVDYEPAITAPEVLSRIAQYEGLVVNSKVYVGKEMLDKGKKLKFICRAGSGLEVFDLDYARQKNVAAFNSPEGNRNAVGEFALGALLNLLRNISRADAEVKSGAWKREENRGEELNGKTIGLIAFGNTAQSFARLLRGFDVEILAYDRYYHNFTSKYVSEASLKEIFEKADVLSLHLPLTAETLGMIDYKFLSSFKKSYWLINTARGKVLQTTALIKCIDEKKIKGAALDVLENENISQLNESQKNIFNKLIQNRQIILSPHVAGWTFESKKKIAEVLLSKILSLYGHKG